MSTEPSKTSLTVQESPRVVRVGNSMYVAIPRRVARLLGIRIGDRMAMTVQGSVISMSRCNYTEFLAAMAVRRPERP